MPSDTLWHTKLHARLHDPAEKALVLLRDPEGHEGGTSGVLRRSFNALHEHQADIDPDNADVLHCVLFKNGIKSGVYNTVKRADWWAAAADRPQWPMQEITVQTKKGDELTLKVAHWAQVRWTKSPVLIHPLTGQQHDLSPGSEMAGLGDEDLDELKSRSFTHFAGLVQRSGDNIDWRRTLLAFWRFGPTLREDEDNGKLGALWPLLPADTRVPDHSIWDHLDLTSAFAGAMADDQDGEVALLTMALGPVQSFIEAARSTSDLWAGSHLLARLAWEAMKPVCEALGPDAILFPRLRGVPQVDLWLRQDCQLPDELFAECEWKHSGKHSGKHSATDANPLFAAALPNRFVAIVPAAKAKQLAQQVERAVRGWLQTQGQVVVDRLLKAAELDADGTEQHCHGQMREQLEGFPEVHWAVVPFSLIRARNVKKQNDLDTSTLLAAMAPFFGVEPGQACGFLASPAWKVLQADLQWGDNTTFWSPNPGALYPAVHDLAERALAAAKAVRPFKQQAQQGWRCSLTGETEWLTTDKSQLAVPAGKRKSRSDKAFRPSEHVETLWTKVADAKPAWAKKGEHLGALPALKRLWPTLFAEEVGRALDDAGNAATAQRFVVSTHTMALAHQIDEWLQRGGTAAAGLVAALDDHAVEPVALPRRLMLRHARNPALAVAKRLPALLDAAADAHSEALARDLQSLVRRTLQAEGDSSAPLETYYGMLLMDGDHMGAWLAGGDNCAISYRESWHPKVRDGFDKHTQHQPLLRAYADQKRAVSPNRHLAISAALNDFSLVVARHVVEAEHRGRLIYAGGDDVLAMLPVADLLGAMQRLRLAYSGDDPAHVDGDRQGLVLKNGFALLNDKPGRPLRLMRMMGTRATASCGAVVAHHQAPLAAVMRELRLAEKRAKGDGGRDAFSLVIVKRSGGTLFVTAKWGEPVALLGDLRGFLQDERVSRRAVYNSFEWLKDLPRNQPAMLASLLAYQLSRQADRAARDEHKVPDLAQRLSNLAFDTKQHPNDAHNADPLAWLQHFMSAAEFLARATRSKA